MASPTTVEQVFDGIKNRAIEIGIAHDVCHVYTSFVTARLEEASARHDFMSEKNSLDFITYVVGRRARERVEASNAIPIYTAKDFWNADYEFEVDNSHGVNATKLQQMLMSGTLGMITLGKIYGHVILKLTPCVGALPTSRIPNFRTPPEYAQTASGTISYPDDDPPNGDSPGGEVLQGREKTAVIKVSHDN